MKRRPLKSIIDALADSALLEMGVDASTAAARPMSRGPLLAPVKRFFRSFSIGMADAAVLEMGVYAVAPAEKRGAIGRHRAEQDSVHADDCQYGDNDACFA